MLQAKQSLCEHEYFHGEGFKQCVKCFLLEIKKENGEYVTHRKQPGKMIVDASAQPEVIEDDEIIKPEVIEADEITEDDVTDVDIDDDFINTDDEI